MKPTLLLIAILGLAAPVAAQSLTRPNLVLAAAGATDVITTLTFPRGGVEVNGSISWLQSRSEVAMVTVGAASEVVGVALVEHFLKATHPTATRRLVYVLATVHFAVSASNIQQAAQQRAYNHREGR